MEDGYCDECGGELLQADYGLRTCPCYDCEGLPEEECQRMLCSLCYQELAEE